VKIKLSDNVVADQDRLNEKTNARRGVAYRTRACRHCDRHCGRPHLYAARTQMVRNDPRSHWWSAARSVVAVNGGESREGRRRVSSLGLGQQPNLFCIDPALSGDVVEGSSYVVRSPRTAAHGCSGGSFFGAATAVLISLWRY